MGTNFYQDKAQTRHIGKRSAAGGYCWDCMRTLCKEGESAVYFGNHDFHACCPVCGAKPKDESWNESSAGRELGFNNSAPAPKKGVRSCSSFSWAMPADEWPKCRQVWDEYGRKYTKTEFRAVLTECPIRFTNSIGMDFS